MNPDPKKTWPRNPTNHDRPSVVSQGAVHPHRPLGATRKGQVHPREPSGGPPTVPWLCWEFRIGVKRGGFATPFRPENCTASDPWGGAQVRLDRQAYKAGPRSRRTSLR